MYIFTVTLFVSDLDMSVNEKLTIQALKDHDKVQPKFSSTSRGQGSKEVSICS